MSARHTPSATAILIREMQENVAKYGRENNTTLLMVQAIKELKSVDAERDRLKALNSELAEAVAMFIAYDEDDHTDGLAMMLLYGEMMKAARAALEKQKGETE